jgi:hypothetical protein
MRQQGSIGKGTTMSDGDFVGVTTGCYIFVGVGSRDEFDKIKRPCEDRGENEEGNHVLVKTVEEGDARVVFQHWIKLRGKAAA